MGTLAWEALPAGRVQAIENRVGPVIKAESVTGGLMPGLAAVLHTEHRRYFLKAAPPGSPAFHLYEREMTANAYLRTDVPAPRIVFASDHGGWAVMLFGYLDAADADLSPASPDLAGVLEAVTRISSVRAWNTAPPAVTNVAVLRSKAAALLDKRLPGYPWDMYAAALAGFDERALTGDRLVHYDLHAGNLKVAGDGAGVVAVDWAFACAGAAWIDAAFLIPRLIEAGHSPADAERTMLGLAVLQAAPSAAVTALAALWSMFREYKAMYGPQDSRPFRAQAAQAGRSWVGYRLNWPVQ